MLNIIVAISENNAIGKAGDLLCHMSDDLRHFKQLTTGHTVVMGSHTYLSLPRRPLPNRRNIVLTSRTDAAWEGAEVARSVEEVLAMTANEEQVFIIGGGVVYRQFLPMADRLFVTHIHHTWDDADTFFPAIDAAQWRCVSEDSHPADERNPYPYTFAEYIRQK